MRQYTRPPVTKWNVNSLAKELGFCFDKTGPMFFLTKDNEAVFDSRSLEEINGFLLGFKYGFRYLLLVRRIAFRNQQKNL